MSLWNIWTLIQLEADKFVTDQFHNAGDCRGDVVERLFLIPKEGTCGRVCEWSYLVSFGAVSFDKHRQTGGYRPTDRQQDFRHPTDQLTLIWPYAPHFSSG